MNNNIAYKAFDYEENGYLVCEGIGYKKKYRIGKEHRHNGELKICTSGLHCCQELIDVYNYKPPGSPVCEIIQYGRCLCHTYPSKICCSRIKIIRKLSDTEIVRIILSKIIDATEYMSYRVKSIYWLPLILDRPSKSKKRLQRIAITTLKKYLQDSIFFDTRGNVKNYDQLYSRIFKAITAIDGLNINSDYDFDCVTSLIHKLDERGISEDLSAHYLTFHSRLHIWIDRYIARKHSSKLHQIYCNNSLPKNVYKRIEEELINRYKQDKQILSDMAVTFPNLSKILNRLLSGENDE